MRKLKKPQVDYLQHYMNCIDGKREPLKTQLTNISQVMITSTSDYDSLAVNCDLFQKPPIDQNLYQPVSKINLKKLYNNNADSPSRSVYDRIRLAANGCCPFCSHGEPSTLDHYLPKQRFPELSVFPLNLVPACSVCNGKKSSYSPTDKEKQYFHPYYDHEINSQWLEALIDYSISGLPTFVFRVKNVSSITTVTNARLRFQFEKLKLAKRYSELASGKLNDIYKVLKNLYEDGGVNAVREQLSDDAARETKIRKNSWQAAMYRSMKNDLRFCTIEWKL